MKITNEFTVHTPIEHAWQVLTDLEGIAPCMPGARLTGVEGDVYQGKVKVKVGPVISEFTGTARFTEKDEAGHRAVIDAKGRDARSAGNAAALVTAVLTADGDRTQVSVDTDLKISGKLAQFGSGMIKEVSGKLLAQFVSNLEAKLAAEQAPPAAAGSDAPAAESGRSATDGPTHAAAAGAVSPASAAAGSPASAAAGSPASAAAGSPASATAGPSADAAAESPAAAGAPAAAESPAGPASGSPADAVAKSPAGAAPESPAVAESRADAAVESPAGTVAGSPSSSAVGSPSVDGSAATLNGSHAGVGTAAPFPVARDADGAPENSNRTAPTVPAQRKPADDADEPEPLDLLSIAGGSIYKRVIPVVIGVVVVGAVIVWLIVRR